MKGERGHQTKTCCLFTNRVAETRRQRGSGCVQDLVLTLRKGPKKSGKRQPLGGNLRDAGETGEKQGEKKKPRGRQKGDEVFLSISRRPREKRRRGGKTGKRDRGKESEVTSPLRGAHQKGKGALSKGVLAHPPPE